MGGQIIRTELKVALSRKNVKHADKTIDFSFTALNHEEEIAHVHSIRFESALHLLTFTLSLGGNSRERAGSGGCQFLCPCSD